MTSSETSFVISSPHYPKQSFLTFLCDFPPALKETHGTSASDQDGITGTRFFPLLKQFLESESVSCSFLSDSLQTCIL